MKGILMMLKSMGINIDSAQIESAIQVGLKVIRHDGPAWVKSMELRVSGIESRLEHIENLLTKTLEAQRLQINNTDLRLTRSIIYLDEQVAKIRLAAPKED